MMKLNENLTCPCHPDEDVDPIVKVRLRDMESYLGRELVINSGYRCPKWNEKVGGIPNSYHTKHLAVDVAVSHGGDRREVVKAALKVGFKSIGVGKYYVHLDMRPTDYEVLWPA